MDWRVGRLPIGRHLDLPIGKCQVSGMPNVRPAADPTRQRLLKEARILFAERGFYGVSLAQVSGELGITKQGLLHYFGTKERLYAEVLEGIAIEYEKLRKGASSDGPPDIQLIDVLLALAGDAPAEHERIRLLVRELLDNRHRAQTAQSWRLKPLLDDLSAMLRAVPGWAKASQAQCLAALVHLIGAISYQAISTATFRGIYGQKTVDALRDAFRFRLEATAKAILAEPPILADRSR